MKKLFYILLCMCVCSCWYTTDDDDDDDGVPLSYEKEYKAVVLKRSDLDSSIKLEEATAITTAAKIYIIDDYIFINDKRRGFHIFDNSNPANPVKKNFLKVPGSTDIAIRNNIFYINQSTDLVVLTFDTTDFTFSINKRVENVFPEISTPFGHWYDLGEDEVVVNWIKNEEL